MEPQNPPNTSIRPRIIIHGGAGNITRETVPPERYEALRTALTRILRSATALLEDPQAKALDVAVHAVSLLEDDPLFNAGKGAVFTRQGTNELEAGVMVSNGYRKRGAGCILVKRVKNPIKLAREFLVRGEQEDGGGASGHCAMAGEELEKLAESWGLEMVDPKYFFTQRRWDEHMRGIGKQPGSLDESLTALRNSQDEGFTRQKNPSWDEKEYIPQGTTGAVVLDRFGTIAVASSTGGITNKIPGRIGDTPLLGAGVWAEEWTESNETQQQMAYRAPSMISTAMDNFSRGNIADIFTSCLPAPFSSIPEDSNELEKKSPTIRHAVGLAGTGNGDSFIRLSAVRTAAALSRFSTPHVPLAEAVTRMAGPGGELQKSAGDRWRKTGEGEAGTIGIELVGNTSSVVFDFNGGLIRAYIDDEGKERFAAFRDD